MTKRIFLLLPLLSILCGCDSLVHKDSDWFELTGHPTEQVEMDDQACRTGANDQLAFTAQGAGGSFYAGNRVYNASYARCMTARHYKSRPYIKNWF